MSWACFECPGYRPTGPSAADDAEAKFAQRRLAERILFQTSTCLPVAAVAVRPRTRPDNVVTIGEESWADESVPLVWFSGTLIAGLYEDGWGADEARWRFSIISMSWSIWRNSDWDINLLGFGLCGRSVKWSGLIRDVRVRSNGRFWLSPATDKDSQRQRQQTSGKLKWANEKINQF
jgi:hypothetical protein